MLLLGLPPAHNEGAGVGGGQDPDGGGGGGGGGGKILMGATVKAKVGQLEDEVRERFFSQLRK